MTARPRFITLEGGEGTGKSTQARRLARHLETAFGAHVVTTREPGGSPRAEFLRNLILSGSARPFGAFAEAVLFSAARSDHIRATIAPALARGAWVISDRFADSTRAYQGALGNLDTRLVGALESVVLEGLRPGLTLVLDLPADEGLRRARARASGETPDRFESEDIDFHEGLRRAFLDIAEGEPQRIAVIDARGSEEEVAGRIWAEVCRRYGLAETTDTPAHG